jgi:hypothetical protein
MNERETERRLRGWLDAQSSPAVPDDLRRAVASIPATIQAGWPDRIAGAFGWRPATVPRPVWLLLAAALLLALATTTAFVGSRLLEGRPLPPQDPNAFVPTAAPGVLPAPIPTPTPSPSPTPSPVVLDPSTAHWSRLGAAPASAALVGFDGGYVALGSLPTAGPPGVEPAAFFSADGVSWADTRLATMVPNCADSGPAGAEDVPDAEVRAIATNGSEVVIVGEESPHDAAGCANVAASVRPVAWYSRDGRTWQRSAPFEVGGLNARAAAVWAIPRGWQAAVQGGAVGTVSIWESSDGLAWHQIMEPVAVGDVNVYAGAAPDGTVVLSRWDDSVSGLRLFTSRDGRTWEPVDTAGGCEAALGVPMQIAGPDARGLDAWVLLAGMRLCTSPDLLAWSGTTMTDALGPVAQTRFGAIALADSCFGAGSTCTPDPRAYLTTDGVTWTPMAHPPVYWGRAVADGPAGVLMVGQGTAGGGATTAWRLDP